MTSIPSLVQQLNEEPHVEGRWFNLAAALMRQKDFGALRNLFGHRHKLNLAAMDFAYATFFRGLEENRRSFLATIGAYPENCPFSAVASLVGAWGHALDFNLDPFVRGNREALRRYRIVEQTLPGLVLNDDILLKAAFVTTVAEGSDWHPTFALPPPAPCLDGQAPARSTFACVAFADSVYAVHYALDFVRGVRASSMNALPVVGILDPGPEAIAVMEAIRAEVPEAVVFPVAYGGDKLPEMAASVRFVLANRMLDFLARPVVFLDIDTHFRPQTGQVLETIARLPLSFQNLGVVPPNLMVAACAVGAHPGEGSRRFFDIAGQFILGKLAEAIPLWTIDQMALHRAVCLADTPMTDLCEAFRGRWEFPAFFAREHSVDFDTREASRTNNGFADYRFLADGSVEWTAALPS